LIPCGVCCVIHVHYFHHFIFTLPRLALGIRVYFRRNWLPMWHVPLLGVKLVVRRKITEPSADAGKPEHIELA
jgi:hypothetical protein